MVPVGVVPVDLPPYTGIVAILQNAVVPPVVVEVEHAHQIIRFDALGVLVPHQAVQPEYDLLGPLAQEAVHSEPYHVVRRDFEDADVDLVATLVLPYAAVRDALLDQPPLTALHEHVHDVFVAHFTPHRPQPPGK